MNDNSIETFWKLIQATRQSSFGLEALLRVGVATATCIQSTVSIPLLAASIRAHYQSDFQGSKNTMHEAEIQQVGHEFEITMRRITPVRSWNPFAQRKYIVRQWSCWNFQFKNIPLHQQHVHEHLLAQFAELERNKFTSPQLHCEEIIESPWLFLKHIFNGTTCLVRF
jgi:hypothetical protein